VADDVRVPGDAARMIQTVLDRHGRLDMLVNNVGGQYFVPAEATEPKGWNAVTRLNVGGTERMSRTAYELAMRPAGGGTIINVTLSPHHGLAGMTHSSAGAASRSTPGSSRSPHRRSAGRSRAR
jgi:citronellol/citronellal dehydrogenase